MKSKRSVPETDKSRFALFYYSNVRKHLPMIGVLMFIGGVIFLDYQYRGSDESYYGRGISKMNVHDYDGAVADFSRALRRNSLDPAARFGLGWAYQGKGWIEEALKQYQMAAESGESTLYFTYHNSGVIYQKLKQIPKAKQMYQKAVSIKPDAKMSLLNLGLLHQQVDEYEQAYQVFQALIAVAPKNAQAHYHAGFMAEKLLMWNKAKRHYQDALSIAPSFEDAQKRLESLPK